jgi:hypothetical protein
LGMKVEVAVKSEAADSVATANLAPRVKSGW